MRRASRFLKRKRELVLGWTLAVSSIGGIFVTEVYNFIGDNRMSLFEFSVADGFDKHATWRYTLLTGLIPGILIALLLPFVLSSCAPSAVKLIVSPPTPWPPPIATSYVEPLVQFSVHETSK